LLSAAQRSRLCSQPNRGRGSALATETELESAPDEFLDLFEESRAVGFVFLGDELSRRAPIFAL